MGTGHSTWSRVAAAALAAGAFAAPGPAAAGKLELEKEPVVLGRTESVAVTIQLEDANQSGAALRLSVNVGSFGEVQGVGPGTYRAVYRPPDTKSPQVALVAAWHDSGPEAPIEFFRIPLHGSSRLPVTTKPGSEVRVEVGKVVFGPVTADAKGKAEVAIDVPPGVTEANVLAKDRAGVITQKPVPIEVPPYNRLTAALVPSEVAADGRAWARLEVFYDAGTPVEPDRVQIETGGGQLKFERVDGSRFVYRYTAPNGSDEERVRFDVTIEGDPAATASTSLALGTRRDPGRLLVGPRVGLAAFGDQLGPRLGVDVWAPFELRGHPLAAGLVLSLGTASQDVAGLSLQSASGALFVPVSARLGYELVNHKRLLAHAGLSATVAFARYEADLSGASETGFGFGGGAFAAGGVHLGPGQLFLEGSFSYAPVAGGDFALQAGGLGAELGYRFRLD